MSPRYRQRELVDTLLPARTRLLRWKRSKERPEEVPLSWATASDPAASSLPARTEVWHWAPKVTPITETGSTARKMQRMSWYY